MATSWRFESSPGHHLFYEKAGLCRPFFISGHAHRHGKSLEIPWRDSPNSSFEDFRNCASGPACAIAGIRLANHPASIYARSIAHRSIALRARSASPAPSIDSFRADATRLRWNARIVAANNPPVTLTQKIHDQRWSPAIQPPHTARPAHSPSAIGAPRLPEMAGVATSSIVDRRVKRRSIAQRTQVQRDPGRAFTLMPNGRIVSRIYRLSSAAPVGRFAGSIRCNEPNQEYDS
ncbi:MULTISPECIES: hypothetical protein [Burkholderia]|uniref:hypothetical protein n=1 Tax=Burkholderia TaxID=32008 RepID=UPI00126A5F52|nr:MULTISPECIES: hypothetical protein [Burkholderia]